MTVHCFNVEPNPQGKENAYTFTHGPILDLSKVFFISGIYAADSVRRTHINLGVTGFPELVTVEFPNKGVASEEYSRLVEAYLRYKND